MTSSATRIVIIGAGGISKIHAAAARALAGKVSIVGIVEPRPDALESFALTSGAEQRFADADAFFASDPGSFADAVVLCTPPNVRVEFVRQSLEAGLAVFSEKPLAHTLATATELATLARTHAKRVTAVGYCHRFTPAMIEMKRRADAGELGEVIRFENTFACWHPGMRASWMSDANVSGGGSFIDTGCHSLDLFRYLIGDGVIDSAHHFVLWPGRGESNATMVMHSIPAARHQKCVGVIQSGWVEAARFDVRLTGTKASLYYDYEKPTELAVIPAEGTRETVGVPTHESRFTAQLEAFSDLVAGRPTQVRPASFEEGWAVSKLVDDTARVRQII